MRYVHQASSQGLELLCDLGDTFSLFLILLFNCLTHFCPHLWTDAAPYVCLEMLGRNDYLGNNTSFQEGICINVFYLGKCSKNLMLSVVALWPCGYSLGLCCRTLSVSWYRFLFFPRQKLICAQGRLEPLTQTGRGTLQKDKHFESTVNDEVTRTFCICFCNEEAFQFGTYRNERSSSIVAREQDFSEFEYMGGAWIIPLFELSGGKNWAQGEKTHL